MHLFNVPCAYAFQRSDCLMLLFLQGLLHFPNLVRLEFSAPLFNLSLPSIDTLLLSLKPVAIGHPLFLRNSESLFKLSLCLLGSSSLLPIALQSFQCRLRHFLFSLHFEPLVFHGLARFLQFSICDTACTCSTPPLVIVLTHLLSIRKLPFLVFDVFSW